MEIAWILAQRIMALFIMLGCGALLVKTKLLKSKDSKVISTISVYFAVPCSIISAFEVDLTDEIIRGMVIAFCVSLGMQILLHLASRVLKRLFHFDAIEEASIVYSNAGNLIIPLVRSLLGPEWVIYSCAYLCVQTTFLWSHGRSIVCGDKKIEFKKILLSPNMIAVYTGLICFFSGFRMPGPVQTAIESLSAMVGPIAMLVSGMLIANMNLKSVVTYKRVWMVAAFRLVIIPLAAVAILKLTGVANLVENGKTILMISYLAMITPSASTITQMAVVFDRDAEYATSINALTTLGCIVTMPLMVLLYQL